MLKKSFFCLSTFILSIFLIGKAPAAKEQETFQKTFNINARGVISLENVNGSVTIKTWDQPKVEVVAIKTGPSQEKIDLVKIDINSQSEQLNINTVYPKETKNVNVAVKYELTVPKTANLNNIDTVNGSIEITGVEGTIETQTVNGSINITGGNTVSAETVNGSIKASLLSLSANEKANFETVNGSINLYLPNGIDAEIDAQTLNGKITSDVPLVFSGKVSTNKQLKGKIGRGGAKLNLETVNGSITLSQNSNSKLP
jgi:DUF4097 and DUF4098 domain-containing protein YvlB